MSENKYTNEEIVAKGKEEIKKEKIAFLVIGVLLIVIVAIVLIYILVTHQDYQLNALIASSVSLFILGIIFILVPLIRKPKDPYTEGVKALFKNDVNDVKSSSNYKTVSDNNYLVEDIDDENYEETTNSIDDDEHNWDDEMTDLEYFDSVDDD